jgi:hypothetical protein
VADNSHTYTLLSLHAAQLQQQQQQQQQQQGQGLPGDPPHPLHLLRTSGMLESSFWDTAAGWQPHDCGQLGFLADLFSGPPWIDTLIPPAAPGACVCTQHR